MVKTIEFDHALKGLLLIGGLSCSGKTTLVNALRQGTLPRAIRATLPEDAAAWPAVGEKDCGQLHGIAVPQGQILQCDLTCAYFPEMHKLRPEYSETRSYDHDTRYKQYLASADDIFIVIVQPQRDQLLQQVSVRSAMVHVPPFARRIASRYVPQSKKLELAIPDWVPNVARNFGPRWKSRALVREQHALLLELYGHPVDLDAMLQDWERWLLKVAGGRIRTIVRVEPMLRARREKDFRLLSEICLPAISSASS